MDAFQDISQQLRAGAWDIVEDWLEESKLNMPPKKVYPGGDEEILDELPTLIGGIAKVIQDPMYLMDLEAGGNLHLVCRQFGRLRHEAGYQIDKLLSDFSLLRQKLWLFCERFVSLDDNDLFELERRLNLAVDRMAATTAEAYYTRSCAELIELAQKDKLTGFLHLKAFQRLLDNELARAKRYHYPLSLVSIDIDDFKRYNLEEGRLEGNRLLQNIARELSGVIRGTDFAARFAGDEFAVLMPQTTLAQARTAAERMRRTVRQLRRDDHPVTVSLGLASYPEPAEDRDSLVKQAQKAMAQAQQDGGDVIKVVKST
ncbi:MAG: GGDEF domain-containing protein [Actinomycetota bacterium]|nr:GGDEF domain-containing protein [Actinomycetota bacterium]